MGDKLKELIVQVINITISLFILILGGSAIFFIGFICSRMEK